MNRFFRTAFSTALVHYFVTFACVTVSGVGSSFPSFACVYFGLLVMLLPGIVKKLEGKRPLFAVLGSLVMLAGAVFVIRMPIQLIGHAVTSCSAGLFLLILRHNTTHPSFAARFRFSIAAVIGVTALVLVAGLMEHNIFRLDPENIKLALYAVIPVAIVLLANGILLLRGLRAQQGIVDERAFNRRQLRDTLIFGGIVTAVFAVDPVRYIKLLLDLLYDKVVGPLSRLISRLLSALFDALVNRCPPNPSHAPYTEPPVVQADVTPVPDGFSATPAPQTPIRSSDAFYNTLVTIFCIVAGALVLAFLIFELVKLIKLLRNRFRDQGSGYPNEEKSYLPPEDEGGKKERIGRFTRDPRLRMRRTYRDFLDHLRSSKIVLKPSDTCSDVNLRAKKTLRGSQDETEEFTELYRTARYRMRREPTQADADRMRELYRRIRDKER